jgi:hypothetical protein
MKIAVILGALVILAGVSIVLNALNIHFAAFRVASVLVVAWLGLSLVMSAFGVNRKFLAFGGGRASDQAMKWSDTNGTREAMVLFGSDAVDLSNVRAGDRVKLSVIFGEAAVTYDPALPIEIKSTTAFGNTLYPDGVNIAFGERTVTTPACTEGAARAFVEVATVFGSTVLRPRGTVVVPDALPQTP